SEELDSPARIVPALSGIEDRHRHRWTGRQVSRMEGVRIGEAAEFQGRRISKESGVDASPITRIDCRARTQLIRSQDPKHSRPNAIFGNGCSFASERH